LAYVDVKALPVRAVKLAEKLSLHDHAHVPVHDDLNFSGKVITKFVMQLLIFVERADNGYSDNGVLINNSSTTQMRHVG
jgi:hypothetical protein